PCLLYALSGSTVGPIAGKTDSSEVTARDLRYLRIAAAAKWVVLGISLLVVVAGIVRGLVSGSMSTAQKALLLIIFVGGVSLFVRRRSPRPEFPPLKTSPDDPLIVEALAKAKGTLGEFRRLLKEPKKGALIKIRFVSSSNEVEHLWAEVEEVLG